jgi:predicted transposase YbfD/YdcC
MMRVLGEDMAEGSTGSIIEHFSGMEDPRRENRRHYLLDIMVIAICAVICGADDWGAVHEFGEVRYEWLKGFLALPHGIPCDETFRRVFARLDADEFQERFMAWVRAVFEVTAGQVIPVDGKSLRRSHDRATGKEAIHMVSAWATENHLVLGQVKVDEKSNEIPAVPELLALLDISGCIVTADALHCQKETARTILERGGQYLLRVKDNQDTLAETLAELFDYAQETAYADCDYHHTVDKGHGRLEIRECWTTSDEDYLRYVPDREEWQGLSTLAMVKTERRLAQKTEYQVKYYISSLPSDAESMLAASRGHWGIENQVHWVLDIAFREDECRLRKGNGAQNFAVLRHMALTLLQQEQTLKRGVKTKRLKAAWDTHYLRKVLQG